MMRATVQKDARVLAEETSEQAAEAEPEHSTHEHTKKLCNAQQTIESVYNAE
jgi:hypothetical protein